MPAENKVGTRLSRRDFIRYLPFAVAGVVFVATSDVTAAAPPKNTS